MARKPKPTRIFREEVFNTPPQTYGNSTRQTFDRKQFEAWRAVTAWASPDWKRRFYIGEITWREVTVPEPADSL